MSSDAYMRSGRGGAGNFFSHDQVEEQKKAAKGDIESQHPDPATEPTGGGPVPGSYMRAGRGGAGNYYEQSTKQHQDEAERTTAEQIKEKVARAAHKSGLAGRGGAGNWTESSDADAVEEDEARRREELEGRVERDIDAGLRAPGKAYAGAADSRRGDEEV